MIKSFLCLFIAFSVSGFAQIKTRTDINVIGTGGVIAGFPTVSVDPIGTCATAGQVVLNTSTGPQKGHLSACGGGAWMIINATSSVSVPGPGLVKSDGANLLNAAAGVDYQIPLSLPLPLSAGGNGTSTPGIVCGKDLLCSGAWPNQQIDAVPESGGPPITSAAQFTDYQATADPTGTQTVTFNGGVSFPFNTSFCSFSAPTSVTVSGVSSDTLYLYVDTSCNRTLGFSSPNLYTLTGFENAAPQPSITAFPSGSFPLAKCTVLAGQFSAPCQSQLNWLARTNFMGGNGIASTMTASGVEQDVVFSPTIITSATYAVQATDQAHNLEFTASGNRSIALPQAFAPGISAFTSGWWAFFTNAATNGTVTITPGSGTAINGKPSLLITAGQTYLVLCEGTSRNAGGTYLAIPLGNTNASPADLAGELAFNGTTSATYIWIGSYGVHPECVAQPQFASAGNPPYITYAGTSSFAINFPNNPVNGAVSFTCSPR